MLNPEVRWLYSGSEWAAIRERTLARFHDRCAECGVLLSLFQKIHVCHRDHDPWNRTDENLVAWCPSCHSRHDAAQHYATWRRTMAERFGQAWLWEEVELAPRPAWWRDKLRVDRLVDLILEASHVHVLSVDAVPTGAVSLAQEEACGRDGMDGSAPRLCA